MNTKRKIIIIKTIAILLSIALALFFAQSSFFKHLLIATKKTKIIGSFIAGIFVASGFTAVPALVALAEIAQQNSVLQTAIIGGLGAFFGDLLIFLVLRKHFSQAIDSVLQKISSKKIEYFVQSKIFKPCMIMLGTFLVITPLPDEIGLAFMGISRMNVATLFFILFPLHIVGIFITGSIAHNI